MRQSDLSMEQVQSDINGWIADWEIDEENREATHIRSGLRFGVDGDSPFPVVLNEWSVGFDGICDLEVASDQAAALIAAGRL